MLSADSGRPTPAMVRLMWRTDGLQRRPANGIEFAPQFDRQGHASGVRAANLPGPLGAHFWCVPGPFDMALAPGTWQIGVRRGVEHEAVFVDVTVRSGETTEQILRPRRWVDMRQEGWWSGDDHVHTRILSDDDARNVMAWVQAEDVHLANIVKMGDIYRTYFEQRGFGPAHRVVDGDHVLVPGQECPRTHDQIGHTLAMNITAMVRDPENYFLYDTVFDAVRAQGGLTGYAHVNSGLFHVHRDMSLNVPGTRWTSSRSSSSTSSAPTSTTTSSTSAANSLRPPARTFRGGHHRRGARLCVSRPRTLQRRPLVPGVWPGPHVHHQRTHARPARG
ncbi:MAG: hypothetical protein M5U12_34515 [Verrucomicrobia bacterium]|nr:hypothetical protein [Verrucomicrobiota bacterium]